MSLRRRSALASLFAASVVAWLLAACSGGFVTTAERGAGPGETGPGSGGSDPGGGSGIAGAAGSFPGGDGGDPAPLPGDSSSTLTTRPGRPHALQIHDRTLYWLRSASAAEPAGVFERMGVEGGAVELAFPASSLVRSFTVSKGTVFVASAKGGIVSYVDGFAKLRAVWPEPHVTEQIAIAGQLLWRVRASSVPGESQLEACSYLWSSGCSDQGTQPEFASAFAHPRIGDLRHDDKAVYFSLRTTDEANAGIRRLGLLVVAGADDPFVVAGDRLVRVQQRSAEGTIVVDAPPRTTGQPRPLFTRIASGLSLPATLGGALYFAEQAAPGVPWRLLRSGLQGGEPTVLSGALCGADAQLPELVASEDGVFVACPGDGTVKRIALEP